MVEQPMRQTAVISAASSPLASTRLFVGGFAGPETPALGISTARIDASTGELTTSGVFTEAPNPFYIVPSASGDVLYVACNVPEGRVLAIGVDDDELTLLDDRSAAGSATVHVCVHPDGRFLLASNHDSGNVVVFALDPAGRLGDIVHQVQHTGSGPHPAEQLVAHPHQVVVDPTGERILVPDKGNDSVYVYRFDRDSGQLTAQSQVGLDPGTGPRQLVFHPTGRHLYVIGELSSTVTSCSYDPATGAVAVLETISIIPPDTEWNISSAIVISPDGRFVYAGNRGHESVAVLAVESDGSRLRLLDVHQVGVPITTLPWDIVMEPGGSLLYVANQMTSEVIVLRIDQHSGLLEPVGDPMSAPTAACLAMV